MSIKTSLIVAMAENRCIGKDNKMPWHISADLKRFKALTMGHPVIMGRKTFESVLDYLGKPLPERTNIVVSRSDYKTRHDNVPIFGNLTSALEYGESIAKEQTLEEIFIIGGSQIYTQSMGQAGRLYMTKVHENVDGDAFFPLFDEREWSETKREDFLDNKPPYSFITLERQ